MRIAVLSCGSLLRCLTVSFGILLALVVVEGAPARAAGCSESAVVLEAGNAFLAAAHTHRASDFADALARYTDMNKIALFALGKYRSSLPAERTGEFVLLTSNYVANTLADFALKFRATGISLIDCRGDQIATRLSFGAAAAKRATWRVAGGKIIDINVQNVWLAQLLRDNYTGILNRAGGNMAILFSNIGAAPERKLGVN